MALTLAVTMLFLCTPAATASRARLPGLAKTAKSDGLAGALLETEGNASARQYPGMMMGPMMGGGMDMNMNGIPDHMDPMMGGGMMNPMMNGAMMNGAMMNGAMMCGPACQYCPPGTHDAGTCQPFGKCGYDGIVGEMLEHFDHCGGSPVGNPMMGGGNMMGGMMGYGNGMMHPGMMNPGMMHPGMMNPGMMHPGAMMMGGIL